MEFTSSELWAKGRSGLSMIGNGMLSDQALR